MNNPVLKMQPPWITYFNKINAMFKDDPDIKVEFNESNANPKVSLYVENHTKAEALQQLLGTEKKFGNITLTIDVIPANKVFKSEVDLLNIVFDGNPIVNQIATYDVFGAEMTFCEFRKEVIQFPNDDCSDLYGNFNGLAEDLARELFVGAHTAQINYCTAIN